MVRRSELLGGDDNEADCEAWFAIEVVLTVTAGCYEKRGCPSTSASVRTVQLTLIDVGFCSRRTSRVALLTQQHKALRLAWARQHRLWTINDCKNVAWSNESRFQLYRVDGQVRVRRNPMNPWIPYAYKELLKLVEAL
ncbi:HTH_Tnp_Tc3_2 domain-containing protein [Trichonephila clavipes]|nr:HTH_Tnp_Tc3_2 domain-containing protein [Trichonephila clavipes]